MIIEDDDDDGELSWMKGMVNSDLYHQNPTQPCNHFGTR